MIGWWLRHPAAWLLRLNPLSNGAIDRLVPAAAATIQSPGEQYQRLTEGLARIEQGDVGAGRLMRAFRLRSETRDLRRKLDRVRKHGNLPAAIEATLIEAARTAGDISADEASRLLAAQEATLAAWEVDVFAPEDYFRDEIGEAASGRRDDEAA